MLRFTITLTCAAGLLIGGVLLIRHAGLLEQRPSLMYPTILFVFLTTFIIYSYLYRLGNPSHFIQLYLFLTVLKLIASLAYNVFLVFADKPAALANVVLFLVAYFEFTLVEIVFLYRQVNRRNDS